MLVKFKDLFEVYLFIHGHTTDNPPPPPLDKMKYGETAVIRAQITDTINVIPNLVEVPDDSATGKLIKAMRENQ
ncbi:MAG: hypothetical protein COU83_01620 [Candidatus Portnoybacteria bacterium CG10_big_fil_rev_8_21_14_0_10_40_22]|uniref:Uncharacterized protein n=1 Tax=Candidatus Portnoybacteria bacterium CG10_big_fil_rev_8_21_14_0_10_40_22 TaxID=1974814 RepID=A0A2M8KG03_9BACT|nr:MAG: hypothetical protein AUJ33_00080 [Parcubacteria group bacterium CG1_02_40_25]PJE58844.1 MAG: hypothetical protein COU83_01620 [Candidatus Portnoybacteria bacterium CG10_big_fil_rev_8_21_14_0_10_40_22]